MFGWISDRFSSSDEARGALASPRTARALITRLETESPQYATEELAKQLHAAPREVLITPDGARALQLLDEWAQEPLAKLWQSLLADSQGQTVKEAVWAALARYYRRSFLAYWQALGLGAGSVAAKVEASASTSAVRAVAAFTRYVLIQRIRYLPVAEDSWTHLWRLMGWAEEHKFATTPKTLYPGNDAATTIEREFLLGLLIEVAPTGNLLPGQMLALDHVLRMHAERYRRADRFDAHAAPFSYEPARNAPPQRYLQGLSVHAGMRFFGPGTAYGELCKARDEASRAPRALPQWLAETGCSTENYLELLECVVAQWSPEPPRRRHRREVCSGEILIAHDLPTIRRLMKFSELALTGQSLSYDAGNIYKSKDSVRMYGESAGVDSRGRRAVSATEALTNLLTFEKSLDSGATEVWQLSDSSESGIGARVQPDCPWIKIGMVVGFRLSDSVDWQVALVRRLSRSSPGPLCIGMARLEGKVRSARLRRGIGAVDYGKSVGGEIEYDALSLKEATTSLILPVGVFDKSQKYTLTCEDKQQVVKMEKTLERRPNFECVEISEVDMLRAA